MFKKSWLSLGLAFILCLSLFTVGCGGGGRGKSGNGGNTGGTLGFAYVKSMDSNNIYAFSINSVTGVLTAIPDGGVTTGDSYSIGEMAADPTGKFLYEAKGSKVSSEDSYSMLTYAIDSVTGGLNLVQTLDMGNQPIKVAVDPAGGSVAVTHTYDGITVFSRDSKNRRVNLTQENS